MTRTIAALATAIIFLFSGSIESLHAQGQQTAVRPRITQTINEQALVRLANTTRLRIRNASDRGRVAADLPMEHILLKLKSSGEQKADLEQFMAQQQDPSSSHYHEWLTPEQFGQRFGVSAPDIAAITNWLEGHGLHVDRVAKGRRQVEFSGTASQVEGILHTEIHQFEVGGESHIANAVDISIPEALIPVVQGVVSLDDFRQQSSISRTVKLDNPAVNFGGGVHGMVPYDFATIYDVLPLWAQSMDGAGQSIAIVGRTNLNLSDVANFRADSGLPANPPQIILNGPNPGIVSLNEEFEATLDVEWSGAVAKGATIKFVVSGSTNASDGTYLSAAYIVDNNLAPVVSMSFGLCEAYGDPNFWADTWQQAASQGMSVFVSSGDSGSAGCDSSGSTDAQYGLGVSDASSTPYNVAVGGTEFNDTAAPATYWNTLNNSTNLSSVKTYIPEVIWNESGPDGLGSSGGGVSTIFTTPAWQTGAGVPTADPGTSDQHHRYVPDVSLNAAVHDGYLLELEGDFYLVSGTSASTPAFAGIMAMVNQVTNQANGNPNPHIYAMAAQTPAAFHDVTTGTNAVPCVTNSPNCASGVLSGYSAGAGYDLASGLGSVDANVFAHAWSLATSVIPTTAPLAVTSTSPLAAAVVGTAYQQALSASGGTPPYRWAAVSGSFPLGLTLNPNGIINGTPLLSGSYTFKVLVTDNAGVSAPQQAAQIVVTGTGTAPVTSVSVTANTYHVFPQFADGRAADGTSYRTTLMISNPSRTAGATCTLQLHGLTVPGYSLTYVMAPGGWTIAATNGTQSFQSGYATLQCTASVEAQLLYSLYASNGSKISEATVFSSPPNLMAAVIADQRAGAQLGLAIANDSDLSVTYTIDIDNGSETGTVTLAPRSSVAKFLSELVQGIPRNSILGVQVSSSSGKSTGSVIGLRFTGSVFTTIPQIRVDQVGATANTYHMFPQFADGVASDGTYYTTTRMYADTGTSDIACLTELRGLTTGGNSQFTGELDPGTFIVAPTNGTQSFQAGYAAMECSLSVEAQALYSFYAPSGVKLSEATVFSSPSAKIVQILADSRGGSRVGLAIANDSDQANTYTIAVSDVTGALVGSATQVLAPRSSIAKFVDQFVTLPANHVGQVIVSSTTGSASIIGLRYTGVAFTTIPETILNSNSAGPIATTP